MAKIQDFCPERQLKLENELVSEATKFPPINRADLSSIPRVRAVDWKVVTTILSCTKGLFRDNRCV